jgi:hypothetical protein
MVSMENEEKNYFFPRLRSFWVQKLTVLEVKFNFLAFWYCNLLVPMIPHSKFGLNHHSYVINEISKN